METMDIFCKGEKLTLSSLKAVYYAAKRMLIVADLHLGKSAYFRKNGIQIPSSIMEDDLARLSLLIQTFHAITILVVGDMFHHKLNGDIEVFKEWRGRYAHIKFVLVPGNHDKLLKMDYEALNIEMTSKIYTIPPFAFVHEMKEDVSDYFIISGHVHPGYVMEGKARQSLKFPCFIVGEHHLILPAFSAFTGLCTKYENNAMHSYYIIGGNKIFQV